MKVTPIAGPAMGAADVGQGTGASQSRREAAKQVLLGNTGIGITEVEKPEDALALAQALQKKPVIKMRTQVSPDRMEEPTQETPEPTQESQESATTDTNEVDESGVTRPISPQFAALAKQRRQLQVEKQAIAEERKALELAKSQSGGIPIEKLKSSPLAALKEAGVTYDSLAEAILAEQSGVNPEVQALKAKIEELEKGIESKFSDRDARAEEQVLAEIDREAKSLVESDPEFEMIRETGSQKKVTELIKRTWKATGEVLDVQEAAKLLEDQLVEDGLKMTRFGKVRSRLTPEQQAQATVPQRPGIKTLTNRDTAVKPMSARARAMAAFNGTLKGK